jgi:hypothetical protein
MEATLSRSGSTGQPSGEAAGCVSSPPPASRAAGGSGASNTAAAVVTGASARCRPSASRMPSLTSSRSTTTSTRGRWEEEAESTAASSFVCSCRARRTRSAVTAGVVSVARSNRSWPTDRRLPTALIASATMGTTPRITTWVGSSCTASAARTLSAKGGQAGSLKRASLQRRSRENYDCSRAASCRKTYRSRCSRERNSLPARSGLGTPAAA